MSSSSVRAKKKSAFSCEPCRRRKVKCGGEQPRCKRCENRDDDCVYKLNPTLSYTQRLEERIKELEDQLAVAQTKSPTSASASASAAASSSHSSPSVLPNPLDAQSHVLVDEKAISRSFRGLKIDETGGITYHGATSFFHLPSEQNQAKNGPLSTYDADLQMRERLVSNAWQQRALENLSDIPEPFQYLLNVHWCWIQPLFNFIYRPAFTRDMQTMGPYYSHTLLNAVLSHSIRWGKRDPATRQLLDETYGGGAVFAQHARSMVFEELTKGVCTIPTVQTLLLLSAQECSLGHSTQAWTYSGLAFRLIDHLGICLDGQRFPGSVPLSDEDVEIRRRMFWSCYFWDKMISLYLGRSPSLQQSTMSPLQVIFDDSSENDLWFPFGASPSGKTWEYPPTTAHSTSAFMSMCRLSLIFNEILIHMYDPLRQNTDSEIAECVRTQEVALQHWWDNLPDYLRIETPGVPELAPPSHIVTMNCLFHTFKILLYRPILTRRSKPEDEELYPPTKSHLRECVSSATSIIAIFDLFCRTFSINYCVLSQSYSVYIAASIFLLQVQASIEDQQAKRRLEYCMQCLNQAKLISPIIGSAVSLINKELTARGIVLDPSAAAPQPVSHSASSSPFTNPEYPQMQAPTTPYQEDPLFQTWVDGMGSDSTMVDPGIFEAMSSFEPLSVRVGAIQEDQQTNYHY